MHRFLSRDFLGVSQPLLFSTSMIPKLDLYKLPLLAAYRRTSSKQDLLRTWPMNHPHDDTVRGEVFARKKGV